MKAKGKAVCALLLVQLLAWGVFVPTADAGKLIRVSSQFTRFDGTNDSTTADSDPTPGAGGVVVYTKSFSVPSPRKSGQQPVVYITMNGTAQHGTATGVLASCQIDGSFCNSGAPSTGFYPGGWTGLLFDFASTSQRNHVNYTWCVKVSPGTHTVSIRLASQDGATNVFLWHAHYFIDRTEIGSATADDCEVGSA